MHTFILRANDPRFEVYPVDPVREDDVVSLGFRWRYRAGDGSVSAKAEKYWPKRDAAHRAIDDFKRETGIGWDQQGDPFDPPILDVDE